MITFVLFCYSIYAETLMINMPKYFNFSNSFADAVPPSGNHFSPVLPTPISRFPAQIKTRRRHENFNGFKDILPSPLLSVPLFSVHDVTNGTKNYAICLNFFSFLRLKK